MTRRVLVLHGPNVNLRDGYEMLEARLQSRATALGVELETFQSNWEAALVDKLHERRGWADAVVVNAASLAPQAASLAEALELVKRPAVEVVLDATLASRSLLKPVATKQVSGRGLEGYLVALELVAQKGNGRAPTDFKPEALNGKTIGKKAAPAQAAKPAPVTKTLGRKEAAPPARAEKSLGRKPPAKTMGKAAPRTPSGEHPFILTRALVREQIADRLAGKLSPAELATWSRGRWNDLQRGAPVESGHRDRLDDVLQQLLLQGSRQVSDHQLIDLMVQLGP